MTAQPWLEILMCPDCGGDKFELKKLPAVKFHEMKIPASSCTCEPEFHTFAEHQEVE